jgi:hypothetical protein
LPVVMQRAAGRAAGQTRRPERETPKSAERRNRSRRVKRLVDTDINAILGCLGAIERSRSGEDENGSRPRCLAFWCGV